MIVAFAYAGLVQSDGLTLSILFGAASFIVGMAGGIIWIVSGLRLRPFDEVARHRTNSPKLRHVLSAQTSARLPPLRERASALAPAQVDKSLLTIADPKWLHDRAHTKFVGSHA